MQLFYVSVTLTDTKNIIKGEKALFVVSCGMQIQCKA